MCHNAVKALCFQHSNMSIVVFAMLFEEKEHLLNFIMQSAENITQPRKCCILRMCFKDAKLYGTKPIELPSPRFVVFDNGLEEQPDRKILKLSELYTIKEEYSLKLKAVMLNVNSGLNKEMMKMSTPCGNTRNIRRE